MENEDSINESWNKVIFDVQTATMRSLGDVEIDVVPLQIKAEEKIKGWVTPMKRDHIRMKIQQQIVFQVCEREPVDIDNLILEEIKIKDKTKKRENPNLLRNLGLAGGLTMGIGLVSVGVSEVLNSQVTNPEVEEWAATITVVGLLAVTGLVIYLAEKIKNKK